MIRRSNQKGFTLIELMIVIAIIAILAAVAMTQYNAYKRKAKAKELVGFARACVMEIRAQCEADSSFNSPNSLDSCAVSGNSKYLNGISVKVKGFSACNGGFNATASGNIVGETGVSCTAVCTYDNANDDISCQAPTCSRRHKLSGTHL